VKGGEFALAVALAIAAGGFVGCCLDRYVRQRNRGNPDGLPNRYVSDVRYNRLHVIEDEWLRGPENRER
jgi:hypothetical protein